MMSKRIKQLLTISPQALDQRFNESAVEFLKAIFYEMFKKQNEILKDDETLLRYHFKAIKVVDSTTIILPENLEPTYRGSGGSASIAAVKVQLQMDLLTGSFIKCDISEAVSNDADYLPVLRKSIEKKDLHLQDLGYFQSGHLDILENSEAYYISKIKSTSLIYIKNDNPKMNNKGEIKKSSIYKKIDIQAIVAPLHEGETIELSDIYIGKDKLKTKLILTKLTQECKVNREKKFFKDVRKGKKIPSDKNVFWNSINIYITNVPTSILTKDQIHDIYSLRWQIELMFKIWKSIFKINDVKKVKLERFQCFLYSRLIALLLTSSIVSTGKKILYEESQKEISAMKSFGIVKEFFSGIREKIFQGEIVLIRFLNKIIDSIIKYGIKSKKKGKKSSFQIVESLKISEYDLEKMVV